MSSVRLEGVRKEFKETVAVAGVDLQIGEGEFFSLLGPSGCGKTTTLRMVGGFEEPTAGAIYLGDREVSGLPPFKRDVNTVFQSYALFPHLDVSENVAYGLKRKKVGKTEIDKRVGEMLDLVDLPGLGARRVNQLSGGQQQRVALARALVNRPGVLLLDEPLGALDLKLRKQMQLELKRIQRDVGITFVYVTHDQDEAMTMSDRIAVMDRGRLEQVGAPQEVYERPRTEFVAGFLGASNLLDGEVQSVDGALAKVRVAGSVIAVPTDKMPVRSGRVRVGVRPEKVTIGGSGGNAVTARIEEATYVGVSTSYACVAPDGSRLVVYVQNADGLDSSPQRGDDVTLSWEPRHTFAVAPSNNEEVEE